MTRRRKRIVRSAAAQLGTIPDQILAMFCNHANEVPQSCPCADNCYCKDNTCKHRQEGR